ncbi:MAG TPA: diguanylate cyclase [Solirubrobacteraceae bacterium]|nr:diguanylate cyclase [Solirubrobacteraceae bacterium]
MGSSPFKPRRGADDIHADGRPHGLPSCRRLCPGGACRCRSRDPRRRLPLRHARSHSASPRRAARLRRAVGLRGRPRRRDARARVRARRLRRRGDGRLLPRHRGRDRLVVSNRRTRNVARADEDPLVAVVEGTEMEPESLVSVPLLVEDRVVAVLNVYRIGLDKSFGDAEVAQVERFATMAALAFDSARQRDTLREQARTDGLTGLLNHRACHERLGEEIARARALERPLSVVVLDLDHFKAVNDAYGHAEGDKVLAAAAQKLRSSVRGNDVVARLGGEEFALILPGVDGARAADAAERARAAIAEVGVGGAALSCSAGVAAYPDDAADAARLLELADGALYWAKRSGRDQSRRYDRWLAGQLSGDGQRAEIEALLAREGSIVPLFQPVLELATGRIAGYEALARMPGAPFRPPDQWFNQAHRAGLGPALEAAALRASLRAPGRPERTFLALNVSPGALLSPEVREALPEVLSGIVIELTEHELFSTDDALDRELEDLRARGARIALDDAGNGYAGLQQIIRVAPDILKLDRSLVEGVHDDPHRFALLEALISFASTTRAAVCAEGVETLDELSVLARMDVTYAQGWALARPDAPWAPVAPHVAAAASAEARIGMRIAREPLDDGAPTLGDLIARLTTVSCVDDIRHAAALIPGVLGADDAAVSRVVPGADCIEDISRHGWSSPGERYRLGDFPATEYVLRARTAGQVVVGDPASDPAEVRLLERVGHQALLMVPLVFGGRDVGLLELYRRHPMPWNNGEIERAQLLAHQLAAVLDLLARELDERAA